jgi:hypothetical protein
MGVATGAPKERERLRIDPATVGLLLIVAAAAALRFATIADQSYWFDEALTVDAARLPFGTDALGIDGSAEPPLYFALTWVWRRVFGDGEAGLRSLSALAGVLTVPVAYSTARSLVDKRTGLIAAGLATVSPALIQYSQEARAYALYVLLSALSFMFVARIRERPTPRRYAGWVITSTLAILAHYFAVFLVVAEAVWLLARPVDRRGARVAVGAMGVAVLALAPLALYQRTHGEVDWIGNTPIVGRLKQTAYFLLLGLSPDRLGADALGVLIIAVVILALAIGGRRTRVGVLLALGAAAAVIALPIVAAAVGNDYVLDRNLLAAAVPLCIAFGAGLGLRRLGWVGPAIAVVTCGALVVTHVRIARSENLHRDDWRAVAKALGGARSDRLVTVRPAYEEKALTLYRRGLHLLRRPAALREVVTITYKGQRAQTPPPHPFRLTRTLKVQRMTLRWYRAASATTISPMQITQPRVWAGLSGSD